MSTEGKPLIVAHETNTFLAYESITRAHTGDPNVLISRKSHENAGEAAAYGDGFYTRAGREGARGTGLTIRFELHPRASLGADFLMKDDYLLIQNRNALRVIPESLNIGPVDYFKMLAQGEALGRGDRGILEKLKRRIQDKIGNISEADQ